MANPGLPLAEHSMVVRNAWSSDTADMARAAGCS